MIELKGAIISKLQNKSNQELSEKKKALLFYTDIKYE